MFELTKGTVLRTQHYQLSSLIRGEEETADKPGSV